MMKNVLLLCALLCLGTCSASTTSRSLLSTRRLAATPAGVVTKLTELESALKTMEDRVTTAKTMPENYFAVRKSLANSKTCLKMSLTVISATEVALKACKFYKPLAAFIRVSQTVLDKAKEVIEFHDEKIASPVEKTGSATSRWTSGIIYQLEGVMKRNWNMVEKVDKKIKIVLDYSGKGKKAAANFKTGWEKVAEFAPKAGTTGIDTANKAATTTDNIVGPITDIIKSINTNTKASFENIGKVATAMAATKTGVKAYEEAVCTVEKPLKEILKMIQPFVDEFEKERCIPCTCFPDTPAVPKVVLRAGSAAYWGPQVCIPATTFTAKRCTPAPWIPAIPELSTPAIASIKGICTLPKCITPRNTACSSAKEILEAGNALMAIPEQTILLILKPMIDKLASLMPPIPMPNLGLLGIPEVAEALGTLSFDWEVESLIKFAQSIKVEGDLWFEAKAVAALDTCTLPQFLQPTYVEGCVNKGFATADKMNALTAEDLYTGTLAAKERAMIPAAATAIAAIAVPNADVKLVCDPMPCGGDATVTPGAGGDATVTAVDDKKDATVIKYVLTLKRADGTEVSLAEISAAAWYPKWEKEITAEFAKENGLTAGSVVIESIQQGSLIINFKVSGSDAELTVVETNMNDLEVLAALANEFAGDAATLDPTTAYTGTGTASFTKRTKPATGGGLAATGGGGGGGAAAFVIILFLIGGVFGVSVYMRKKNMGPFAEGKKLRKFPDVATITQTKWKAKFPDGLKAAMKKKSKTSDGGANPTESADATGKEEAAKADGAAADKAKAGGADGAATDKEAKADGADGGAAEQAVGTELTAITVLADGDETDL